METSIESLHKDLQDIKRNIYLIKHILSEEFELTDYAKKSLKEARKTPKNKYISNDELKKRLLR
ncbi:MAG: hypothetical protein AABW41_03370 [Nanoarchaeota archaeon]|mgnify:CR=1 FL=1